MSTNNIIYFPFNSIYSDPKLEHINYLKEEKINGLYNQALAFRIKGDTVNSFKLTKNLQKTIIKSVTNEIVKYHWLAKSSDLLIDIAIAENYFPVGLEECRSSKKYWGYLNFHEKEIYCDVNKVILLKRQLEISQNRCSNRTSGLLKDIIDEVLGVTRNHYFNTESAIIGNLISVLLEDKTRLITENFCKEHLERLKIIYEKTGIEHHYLEYVLRLADWTCEIIRRYPSLRNSKTLQPLNVLEKLRELSINSSPPTSVGNIGDRIVDIRIERRKLSLLYALGEEEEAEELTNLILRENLDFEHEKKRIIQITKAWNPNKSVII